MHRLGKPVRQIVKIIVGIEIGWLVLGNLFLNTGIGPWLVNIRPEKLTMHWDSAWTPYPARIYVEELEINIHTWTTDSVLRADQVNANIRILPLFSNHLLVDNVTAGTIGADIVRNLPEGDRPAPAKHSPGMLLEFRDMEVKNIGVISVNQVRIIGGIGRGSGTIKTRIRGEVEIPEFDLNWKDASIELGQTQVAESISIGIQGGIAPFLPRQEKGRALLGKFSAVFDLEGTVDSLIPLIVFFPDHDWVEKIDGQGGVEAHLDLDKGLLNPGSKIDVVANHLDLDFLGFTVAGSGNISAEVSATNGIQNSLVNMVFNQFSLQNQDSTTPLATGQGLSLTARGSELGLVKSSDDLELVLDIPISEVPDISFLGSSLPEELGISISRGKATLHGKMTVSGGGKAVEGKFQLLGQNLQGRFRNMDFDMDMELTSKISGKRLHDFAVDLTGTEFKLFNGIFDNQAVKVDKKWWMTLSVPEGEATLTRPFKLDADVDMSMKDTRAIIALFAEVKDWVRYFDGILTAHDLEGSAKIIAGQRHASISGLELTGDRLELMAEVELGEENNRGIFWGKLGIFDLGMERKNEERDWKFIRPRHWYEKRKAQIWSD